LIEGKGCRLLFLPPKGKHFNPIELFFGTAKQAIRQSYSGSVAAKEKRHRTDKELIEAIAAGCAGVKTKAIEGFFRERKGIRNFKKVFPHVEI
jgi:hypothetical protein